MSNRDRYSNPRRVHIRDGAKRSLSPISLLALTFGHPLAMIGWGVFGFTMIFGWVFGFNSDIVSLFIMRGEKQIVQGVVTERTRTAYSEGGSDNRPGTPVFEYVFSYRDNNNTERYARSFTLGSRYRVGQEVPVEYLVNRPDYARIEGARMRPFGMGTVFVFIFPIVAIGLLVAGMRLGLKRATALSGGQLTTGRLVDKEPTGTKINDQTVFKLTFHFEVDGKQYACIAKTHRTHLLEDDEEEQIIYNPRDPSKSVPVDILPGGMVVDEDGNISSPSPKFILFVLLLPTVAILLQFLMAFLILG
jgi:hypothetical protein